MEDRSKLRVRIGVHEFEAEGPAEQVAAQYNTWKELIEKSPQSPSREDSTSAPAIPAKVITEVRTREGFAAPWDIFGVDKNGDLMSLRVHPPAGETRDSDAILLVLYGYRKAGNQGEGLGEVPVTKLKESLDISGLKIARIDRAAAPYVKAGYILKSGRAKGGVYRLTVTGFSRAEEMAHRLFAQLV
jgi:hypothetical protein